MKQHATINAGRWALLLAILCLADSCTKKEPADETRPAVNEEAIPADDYISPDNFNLIEVEFNADTDEESAAHASRSGNMKSNGLRFSLFEDALEEADAGTRTALTADNQVVWNEGDKIKVYYYQGVSNFTAGEIKHGGASQSSLKARVNESDKYYYAFYPYEGYTTSVTYEGDATYSDGALTVTIPATQSAVIPDGASDNFATCHIAVGKADKETQFFKFSNVGSYMKVYVTNTTATAITLQSSDGEHIVGTFTVPFNRDGSIGEPVIDSGSGNVTIHLPERTGAITVYIALLPNVSFKGFRIRYEYGDAQVHPGYANAKRSEGERVDRSIARRHVLNVGHLDSRIHEHWYVVESGSGSFDDVDNTSTPEAGSDWEHPLNLTGFFDLLSQKVDGSGTQINLDTHDRGWMLDGSTIHLAEGTYAVPATDNQEGLKMEFSGYSHPVNIRLIGNYQKGAELPDSTNHPTILNAAATGKGVFVLGQQTEIHLSHLTFSGIRVSSAGSAALKVDAGNSGNAIFHISSCVFSDNEDTGNYASAGCVIDKGTGDVTKCTFKNNSAGSGAGFCVGNSTNGGGITLSHCRFENNTGTGYGGAIALYGSGRTCSLTDCIISGNTAAQGGFAYIGRGTLSLFQCGLYNNYTTPTETYKSGGGAIYLKNDGNVLTAGNCCFKSNYCSDAYTQQGGVLYVDNKQTVSFTNCIFESNMTYYRGGVAYIGGTSKLRMNGCILLNNSAKERGMITAATGTRLIYLNRVTFKGNTLTAPSYGVNIEGGGSTICMNNVTSVDNTANIAFNSNGNWLITNSTIIDETAASGAALVRSGAGSGYTMTAFNNILINKTKAQDTWRFTSASTKDNCGYNVVSSTGTANNMPAGTKDVGGKDISAIKGNYSAKYTWKSGSFYDIYGVYYIPPEKFSALGFSSPTKTDLETTLKEHFAIDLSSSFDGVDNVGDDFYQWLDGMQGSDYPAGWNVDGRYLSREYYPWYPGAYQPSRD